MKPTLCSLFLVWPLVLARGADSTPWASGVFQWKSSEPLLDVAEGHTAADPWVAFKDPTMVFHEGRWHLFGTLRKKSGTVCMQYLNFTDWPKANAAERHQISFTDKYHCAPQVFYFRPHQRWYLLYQLVDTNQQPRMAPYCSTTTNLGDPSSWSKPVRMVANAPPDQRWIDFWIICDARKAHLFYTSNNGHMWRRETLLANFPLGWSQESLALQADVFEASHTYKIKDRDQYLTVIEAQGGGRRYYKAYVAGRLEGPWRGLADTREKPFAAIGNVTLAEGWTSNISHGELLRAGVDERMEVNPADLRFLYQGASDSEYRGNPYGLIPWRLGLLEQAP